ncbi:sugar phosphate isomerase/epimerase [Paenibacillus agaridevorans]|uniref:Xylose isomerase n=1 Tax=Paenibacillus agaridevorans TaxID=171404 RepID=A0A2R5EU21_9BACL|nr:sugar phosphate isomerase/epimerase family protein [Paenibacillus agaridevorans]GBG10186.1 sugar phosphate isomerase/epimerase [Paenibacillus agaridevorans]
MTFAGYAVILSNLGSSSDRFVPTGYGDRYTIEQLFERAAQIPQVGAVELVGTWHVTEGNVRQLKDCLDRTGLKLASIIPDHFGQPKWKKGSFASKEASIRAEAISHTKEMADVAVELGCDLLSLWPGQDGYDYLFQSDYVQERQWFVEGIREASQHRSDVRYSLEYKIKEPRTHGLLSTAANALLIAQQAGGDNVGVTIDFGHSLNAYETPAEAAALLQQYGGKLFHVHMNDNYRHWDDDMIVGSVHTIETLEFFYWLRRLGYQGWLSIDQYPYREDGLAAVREGVLAMEAFNRLLDSIPSGELEGIIARGEATESTVYLRNLLLRPIT